MAFIDYRRTAALGGLCAIVALAPTPAAADNGGVSFWLPGTFGSLAAAPARSAGATPSAGYSIRGSERIRRPRREIAWVASEATPIATRARSGVGRGRTAVRN